MNYISKSLTVIVSTAALLGGVHGAAASSPACPADFDCGGGVNAADLALLLGAWGPCAGCDADLNGSGGVDAADLALLLGSWGPCTAQICGTIAGIVCENPAEFCLFCDGTCQIADNQGLCMPFPTTGCPDIYDPVCGCDGLTYANRCDSQAAGVSVDHEGTCEPQICGTIAGLVCDHPAEFCLFPDGTCDVADNQGLCTPIPGPCPENYDPVCGCDGITYANHCHAHAAGVSVDHEGTCELEICGGKVPDPLCDDPDEFCLYPDNTCDIADNLGICTDPPQFCPDVYDPVCGCDGVTYGNRCEAYAVGVSVDYEGTCEFEICGTIAGLACDGPGEFCLFPDGTCDVADNQGICTPYPDLCLEIYDPVCGCDGVTYGNRCHAHAAGVSVDHVGTCEAEICGTIAGLVCDDPDEFCLFPDGTCEVADNQGVCTDPPQICPDVFDPVCGCDGVTYGNLCEAYAAGVSVDHEGTCELEICGTIAGLVCDDPEEFCLFPDNTCEVADNQGICTDPPQVCPGVFDPVCGCDGVTYSNRCEAEMAGISVHYVSPCLPDLCGTIVGLVCDDPGEFCLLPDGTCDGADIAGACTAYPLGCPDVYDPVCGCDGVTYSNRCESQVAGVSVDHTGPC